ncbi:class I SAM-dependent methyltransferase [Candidatus Bathyarchaeota archaeon]|nr:class I SAM-dependent methyltransferase [Candidatus Bathyarchaeota archaeon]
MASRPSLRALGRVAAPLRTPRTRLLHTSAPMRGPTHPDADRRTHFGRETVSEAEKTQRVAGVFHSVAESYDKMNDLMSFGWHRIWKCVLPSPPLPPSLPVAQKD